LEKIKSEKGGSATCIKWYALLLVVWRDDYTPLMYIAPMTCQNEHATSGPHWSSPRRKLLVAYCQIPVFHATNDKIPVAWLKKFDATDIFGVA
jgi:hypothetical protein